jgi:hypothetical protein
VALRKVIMLRSPALRKNLLPKSKKHGRSNSLPEIVL